MRKFDTNRAVRRQKLEKAEYKGKTWNVVDAKFIDEQRHIYYQLRRPYAKSLGPIVRCDKLLKL